MNNVDNTLNNASANVMTGTPVNAMLFKMAAPISLGMLSTFLFQIVDTYFVGQLGSDELAALAFSSTIYLIFVSIFMGLSVGVSAVTARIYGEGLKNQARSLTSSVLLFVAVISVLLTQGASLYTEATFAALGASGEVLKLTVTYMDILYLGFPLLMLGIVGSGAVRAIGVTKETEIIFTIAGVINLVFDYLLIFGVGPFPALGLAGAAWATAMSFAFIALGVGIVLIRHNLLGFAKTDGLFSGLKDITKMSIPTISMQILIPVTGIIITVLLAKHGSEAVAAYGVAARIEALALIGIFAVSMAVTPFIAQNMGAKEHDRIDDAIVFSGKASIYIGALLFIVLVFAGPWIARIFSDDAEVIRLVGLYFKIIAISYGFMGILNVTISIFNGLQLSATSLKIMSVRTFIIVIPLIYIGSLFGVLWLLVGLAAGNIIAAFYAGYEMRKSMRKWNRPIANAKPWKDIWGDIKRLGGIGSKR
jgi:putative MATE family efflux protein